MFPYYTDDKITELQDVTGNKTIIKILSEDKLSLWEPFSLKNYGLYDIERNLYKNLKGIKVIFEEINNSLGLVYKYQWSSCDEFGFVKKSSLTNNNDKSVQIELLDGIQNILPWELMNHFKILLVTWWMHIKGMNLKKFLKLEFMR